MSRKPFTYAKMPPNWTATARGRCVVCLRQPATRYLIDYFNDGEGACQDLRLCDACEPGKPCAAFPKSA